LVVVFVVVVEVRGVVVGLVGVVVGVVVDVVDVTEGRVGGTIAEEEEEEGARGGEVDGVAVVTSSICGGATCSLFIVNRSFVCLVFGVGGEAGGTTPS
jgi:hypothetical protein